MYQCWKANAIGSDRDCSRCELAVRAAVVCAVVDCSHGDALCMIDTIVLNEAFAGALLQLLTG
jgi:hypothetical protein